MRLIESAQPLLSDMSSEEKMSACLESLAATNQTRFVTQILSRSKHACKWVQRHRQYVAWAAGTHSSLLWISAKAGCGKTTIAAHISRMIQVDPVSGDSGAEGGRIVLSFFFRKSNQASENTALAALRSITSQLARQKPRLLALLFKRYESLSVKGAFEWPWDNLSAALVDMLDNVAPTSRVYIIVDAIDECEVDRQRLLEWLKALIPDPDTVLWESASAAIKILITSRPGGEILEHLEDHPTLAIRNTETSDDIRTLVLEKLGNLARRRHLRPEVTKSIERFLLTNAHGMFLWVVMIFDELEKRDERLSDEVIAAKLSKIPLSLVDTYTAILRNTPSAREKELWTILRWVLFGSRGLTVEELESAVCLEFGISKWYDFAGDLELLCGSLIRNDGPHEEINFVHQTARSFLQAFTSSSTPTDFAGVEMNPDAAHAQLAMICVKYLLREEGVIEELGMLAQTVMTIREYLAIMNKILRDNPFLRYAIESWTFHLGATHAPPRIVVEMLYKLMASGSRRQGIIILHYFINKHGSWSVPQPTTPLHTIAYFNLHWLLEAYPAEYADDVDSAADMGDTPLVWASETGSAEAVRWLLEMGADTNKCEYDGWSALHWAARNGHMDVAKLLLNHGAHLDQEDSKGHTPLDWALDRGYWDVVDVLQQRAGQTQFAGMSRGAQDRRSLTEDGSNRALQMTWKLWDDRP